MIERATRGRTQGRRSVPWEMLSELDVVAVDTTWGELQPMQVAPGVRTVGELELPVFVKDGATLVDSRTDGSFGRRALPGALNVPHDQTVARIGDLNPDGVSVMFCNGPQCPQSPDAIWQLLDNGFPATAMGYYRGGLHNWVTLALPTQPV